MSLIPHLPGMMSQWRQKITEKFLSIFPGAASSGVPLAVHVALCTCCAAILFYPQVLAHHCLTKSPQSVRRFIFFLCIAGVFTVVKDWIQSLGLRWATL